MIQAELCVVCGRQLPGGDLRGFCPTCLLKAALDPSTTTAEGSVALGDSETDPPDRADPVSSVPIGIEELRRPDGFQPDCRGAADGGGNGAGQDAGTTASFTGADHAHPARFGFADFPSIPGYEIRGILGEGGMGVVYEALQSRANRLIALKMIRGDAHVRPEQLQRFRAEAQAVARLRHPNVVQIFEVGEAEGHPYFSLELLAGGTLKARLAEAPLPPRPAAELTMVLAGAIHAAHQAGIVHRDLKPANILFDCDDTPKIADFGLAKRLEIEDGQTITGQVMGTPSYMAPEQASGKNREVGPSADVYALGAILYEVLTGRPPFKGTSTSETLLMVISEDPVPPSRLQPRLPRDLETICLKCLAKEPARRYETALEPRCRPGTISRRQTDPRAADARPRTHRQVGQTAAGNGEPLGGRPARCPGIRRGFRQARSSGAQAEARREESRRRGAHGGDRRTHAQPAARGPW